MSNFSHISLCPVCQSAFCDCASQPPHPYSFPSPSSPAFPAPAEPQVKLEQEPEGEMEMEDPRLLYKLHAAGELEALYAGHGRGERVPSSPFLYLAGPYSSLLSSVRYARYLALTKAAGVLMSQGFVVYSPITHNHEIATITDLPTTWDFWKTFDEAFLRRATHLVVLQLEGWRESVGVACEIALAREMSLPVLFIEEITPSTLFRITD